MRRRSRAHDADSIEAGSIEADSRKAKRFLAFDSQPWRPGATRAAKSSQPGRPREPDRASKGNRGSQMEPIEARLSHQERPRAAQERQERPQSVPTAPKSAPRAPQSDQRTPKRSSRASQDRPRVPQERQIEAARSPWSAQSAQIEATGATLTKHCPCAAKSTKTLALRSKIDALGRPKQPDRAIRSSQEALLDARSVVLGVPVAVGAAKSSRTTPNRASKAPPVARLVAQLSARLRCSTRLVEQFRY